MAQILLIDDDELVARGLARLLGRMGHDVRVARNGKEGLRHFTERLPELVITDINMPEMDGVELIMAFQPTGVPVIAISGGGRMSKEVLLDNAEMLGAVETLSKPIVFEDLKAAVDKALGTDGETGSKTP